ncbi:hypothetical protein KAI04_01090 [Candidatus Pacearchaeota archaeon]|nr:hypothetical protein [Candidatus Pacearchaeota archaeon]
MENVQFNDWQNLDLKVGEILEIEDIENADKLYKLTIDLGTEKRILVSGLKEFYSKEDLKNKKCVVFANLEPKTLRGVESKGMILAAVGYDDEGNEKEVKLIQPDADIAVGSKVS